MKQKNLELFNLARRYKGKKIVSGYGMHGKRIGYWGKHIYDYKAIAKEAKQTLKLNIDPRALSRFLYRARKYKRRGLRSGRYLKGTYRGSRIYEQTHEIFGNVNGKRGFNAGAEEIRRLVLAGESLQDHHVCKKEKTNKEVLEQNYRLSAKRIEGEWNEAEEWLQKLTPQELEALRNWESTIDSLSAKKRKPRGQLYKRKFKTEPTHWRRLPEQPTLDFLAPHYTDPLTLLNQGHMLETPSAWYRKVP